MVKLTARMLIEALSQLSEEQKDSALLLSYHQFAEMTNIQNGLDHLGNLLISQVVPVITVPEKQDPDGDYIQVELFPKAETHPDYLLLKNIADAKSLYKSGFFKEAQRAGKRISKK